MEKPIPALAGVLGLLLLTLLVGDRALHLWDQLSGPEVESVAPTYPFGRGRVVLVGDSLIEIIPPAREGESWTVAPSDIWKPNMPSAHTDGPFRTPEGEIRWFGEETLVEDPPRTLEFHSDGTSSVFYEGMGDDGYLDLAPSGNVGLLMSEEVSSPSYRQSLIRVDEPELNATVLYRTDEMLYGADWSPDGHRIAAIVSGAIDTLLILTPAGAEVARFPFPQYRSINQPRWCDDSRHLLVLASGFRDRAGVLVDTQLGSIRESVDSLSVSPEPLCLGNGRGALFQGAIGDGSWILVQDFLTDSLIPLLPTPPGWRVRPAWLPDAVDPPVWRLEIAGSEDTVEWGASQKLVAKGFRTDGTEVEVPVEWESSDPGVASVNPSGTVTGNRAGKAVITAVHEGWVKDSVTLTVQEALESPGGLLWRETFDDESLGDWLVPDSTFPRPEVVRQNGENVLSLRGDGRYRDYIQTNEVFSLQYGVTVELEFRLPLKRADKERILLCLKGDSPEAILQKRLTAYFERGFCALYPSAELSKRRGDLLQLSGGDRAAVFEVSADPDLPSSDWVHLALQIRPDGTFTVFVNRQMVSQSQHPLEDAKDYLWKIELGGASVDTELLVRNLTLWRGERFEVPDSEPAPSG